MLRFLTSIGAGIKIFLTGQCNFQELVAFLTVLAYAYSPLYFSTVSYAIYSALQHTVWLIHNLICL